MNKELAAAKKDKTTAQSELDSYKELLNNAVLLKTQAEEIGTLLNPVNEQAKYRDSTDPEEKAKFDAAKYEAALKAYNDACAKYGVSDYNEALQKSNTANEDYNTKAQAAEQKKSTAESSISSLESRKTELETKIADTTTKLNAYN